MLIQYTYRSDDPAPSENNEGGEADTKGSNKSPETKTFEFYTVVDLGDIVPNA